ncbi:MAG: DUF3187 family protein, partial [Planctomycetota bacterium]|nr:DUF3187 family protein [Planctomycetota bacterium]
MVGLIMSLSLVSLSAEDAGAENDQSPYGKMAGPLPMRTIEPLRLLFFQFSPEQAETLGEGRWLGRFEYSQSNVLHPPEIPTTEYVAHEDFGITRFNLGLRHGLTDRFDLGAEMPIMWFNDGFMDTFILDVEEFFEQVAIKRIREARGQYAYELSRDGETFLVVDDDTVGVGDLALTGKYHLFDQGRGVPDFSVRAALKFPTGIESDGMGSGSFDAALGFAADWDFRRWAAGVNFNTTFTFGDQFSDVHISTSPYIFSGHFELEYRFSKVFSLHIQTSGISGPFTFDKNRPPSPFDTSEANMKEFIGRTYHYMLGITIRPNENWTIYGGAVEDYFNSADAASDFSFFVVIDH